MAQKRSEVERLLAKVRKAEGCWLWTGGKANRGYGMFYLRGHLMHASRAAWILLRGPVPEGMLVLHQCDNPPCVNPDHLFLGTARDNTRDMWSKGRQHDVGSLSDHQRSKTHCPAGHEYTEANTRWRRDARECRTCTSERSARIARERKEARHARGLRGHGWREHYAGVVSDAMTKKPGEEK